MPESVDACVESILADPNFKPKDGKTKKESAFAICNAEYKEIKMEDNNIKIKGGPGSGPKPGSRRSGGYFTESNLNDASLNDLIRERNRAKNIIETTENIATKQRVRNELYAIEREMRTRVPRGGDLPNKPIHNKNNNREETIKKRNIWIPLSKNFETNEYQAILSDTSIDRDNERMSKDLLIKWSNNPNKFIPMLMDHKNEIMNMVGQWTNPALISNGDNHALAMTPKWFTSNPNAQIVKGMLDEGANIGLSIGAIPKNSREYKSGDNSCKEWTEAELIEASLVPIGSNRNSFISIAKSFGFNNEKKTMENEVLRKDLEAEPEAEVEAELEVEESTEEEAEAEPEAEESVEKSLAAELALLRKEIKALKTNRTPRKAVLKALNENTEVIAKAVVQEDMSVWEQIATLKGIKYGEKYW